jgi:two-component system, NarL family, response regulator DevR
MTGQIKLMLVDDHEVVRLGLRALLSMYPVFEIVGEATNADQAISMALQKQPNIILMDIRMPGKSGIDACREIKNFLSSTNLIMLTSFDDEDEVYESILAGASGYVLKEIDSQHLIQTIETVAAGKSALDPSITDKVLKNIRKNAAEKEGLSQLTSQEKQILSLIAKGRTNREIGVTMILSEKTIRNYVSLILEKLNLHNRTEAAAYALQHHPEKLKH